MPRNEDGSIDLESPLCMDMELLNDHIEKISKGVSFDMPYFDFTKQARGGYKPFKVDRGDVVIFEGIHALNPMVTGSTDTTKIYVSVRTRLVNDNGEVFHPRRIRLMRRLMRDSLFRGREYKEVFNYFRAVSKGEENYIMPFKHLAQFDIDTFHAYETSVYKNYLLRDLVTIQDAMQTSVEYDEIVSFLSEINELNPQLVPNTSIVREFIGGSSFQY
jgi:uridine kinase